MDMHLAACMGKLVGPAGGGGGAGGGSGGISTQFRVLPNSLPSECYSVDTEKVPVGCHRSALHLRVSSSTPPHRTFSPEPFKIGEEYLPAGSSPPIQDANTGFLLPDAPTAVRRPSLTHSASGSYSSPPKQSTNVRFVLEDGDDDFPQTSESAIPMVTN